MTHEPHAAYEAPSVNVGYVLACVFGFIGFAALAGALIGAWYFHAGVTLFASPRAFPDPQLETRNAEEWDALRARQQARANGYDWVDRANGLVRIPVARAMAILVSEGARAYDPPEPAPNSGSGKP